MRSPDHPDTGPMLASRESGGVNEEARAVGDERGLQSKPGVLAALRRAGIPEHTVQALDAALEDPVDLRRDGNLLARYGVTHDGLIDRMGGSP